MSEKATRKSDDAKKASKKATLKKQKLVMQPPRGMRDILPQEQVYWQHIQRVLDKAVQEFGFNRIQVPMVEFSNLFIRSIGEDTDAAGKEMYSFTTPGGDKVALRPELTAGTCRAFIQHGMHVWAKPVKLFSQGSIFRHDRPQEGRYREFAQASFDVFGEMDPILDAQVIQIAARVLTSLGLKRIAFSVNSIGCKECRPLYRKLLVSYFRSKKTKLCQDCKRRLTTNPLRILDCKEEKCSFVKNGAPQAVDHLCKGCHDHFKHLLEYLDELGVQYSIDPFLVRGLDYYNRTVFEFSVVPTDDDAKKALSLGGGGRYDGLIESLGGESTPAIGFSFGLDRMVLQMKRDQTKLHHEPKPKVFLAQLGEMAKKKSLQLFGQLEKSGILVAESFGRGSLKAQLRQASKIKAEVALILGQKEALDETVIVKDMISGSQETVAQDDLVDFVKRILKNNIAAKTKK